MEKYGLIERLDPVWALFLRRNTSRLVYWLSVLGYNARDRSASNRIYLIYFCVFWLVWVVAVFALLGSSLVGVFGSLPGIQPAGLAVSFGEAVLSVWGLALLWQAARRSPFVFTEEDAYLLCQTPVSRWRVGIAWFLQYWMAAILPFAAGAIVISFALVEWQVKAYPSSFNLFKYLTANLQAIGILIPLHMAILASIWGAGGLRLRGKGDLPWLRLAAPLLAILLIVSLFVPALRTLLLAPFYFPLRSAFLGGFFGLEWWASLSLCLLYLGLGYLLLYSGTKKMNLGRAAQETTRLAAIQQARSYWDFSLAEALAERQRLDRPRPPSRLPLRPGSWVLVWKDAVQSLRSIRLAQIGNWFLVFSLSLGMFFPLQLPVRLVVAGLWTISYGGLATQRLRNDLGHWWLLGSLPLRATDILKADIILSLCLGVGAGWLALIFSSQPAAVSLNAALLLPFLAASSALGSANDILRRSKARVLLSPSIAEENVPQQNIGGAIQSLISVLIPFGMLAWSAAHPAQAIVGLLAVPLAAVIVLINFESVVRAYRWIE